MFDIFHVCNCLVFQNARHDEAWMILRRVHDTNWKAKGEPERVFTVRPYIQGALKSQHTQPDLWCTVQTSQHLF